MSTESRRADQLAKIKGSHDALVELRNMDLAAGDGRPLRHQSVGHRYRTGLKRTCVDSQTAQVFLASVHQPLRGQVLMHANGTSGLAHRDSPTMATAPIDGYAAVLQRRFLDQRPRTSIVPSDRSPSRVCSLLTVGPRRLSY